MLQYFCQGVSLINKNNRKMPEIVINGPLLTSKISMSGNGKKPRGDKASRDPKNTVNPYGFIF